jgi:hypothetical protein
MSSPSSRLNAAQAKPAPIAKAARAARKNPVGRSLIQSPEGHLLLLGFSRLPCGRPKPMPRMTWLDQTGRRAVS